MIKFKFLPIVLLALISARVEAAQHKTISSAEGLSNNAILSLHQNNIGHIYIGTADGLNIWNGHAMQAFQAADGNNYFFGNMIRHIFPLEENTLYLQTNYGLACLDTRTKELEFYKELAHFPRLTILEKGRILAMDSTNNLHLFSTENRTLTPIGNNFIPSKDICRRIIAARDGRVCIFTDKDIYIVSLNLDNSGVESISEIKNLNIKCRHISPTYNGSEHCLITSGNLLLMFNAEDCSIREVCLVNDMPDDIVSGLLPSHEGFYISFQRKGLYFLPNGQNDLIQTDVDYGIFSMIPDKKQPVIWIGTDSNGLIRYSKEPKNVNCITYDMLPHQIKMPIRSIHVDRERTLWFGTKGDGLYAIPDFGDGKDIRPEICRKMDTENSLLNHNSVYAITESKHGFLWIGTEGEGLNVWSYSTRRVGKVPGSGLIRMIHSIIEENDSTLWVATDGGGAYRCSFAIRNATPVITKTEPVNFSEPFNRNTSIFTMKMQNDSTIWFGSRGKGVLSYNTHSGKSRILKFPTGNGFAVNETFYIAMSDRMLFATGNGLVTYSPEDDTIHQSGFIPQKATHGIACDKRNNIWVSTNSGIVSLDSTYNYRLSYDRFSGLEVLEYSDGACCYDSISDKVIFGGINGLTIIGSNDAVKSYIPDINITNFIQNDISSHISSRMDKGRLTVPCSKSIFGIEFSVVDHLHYTDYDFLYNIEGYNTEWVKNNGDIIYLPSLDPGKYRLKIVYINRATRYRSHECVLPIYITPPFYRSWWAYGIYFLLACFAIFLLLKYNRQKYDAMQEKIHKKYSAKIEKITSETTSEINQELSVQLTFIIGLCQQIRQAAQNNQFVADKVNLVEYNIAKINKTLHIFNEYKGITESLINSGETAFISVSQTVTEILELMQNSTKIRNVSMKYQIEDGITLALNKEAFLTMLYSLIYKVISTARGQKTVDFTICREEGESVLMKIVLTSDRETYESMYSSITDAKPSLMEGEYDIIFCNRLISLMNGTMGISFDDRDALVILEVRLPSQKTMKTKEDDSSETPINESINTFNTIIENQLPKNFKSDTHPDYIYIISHNRDISSFLGYFLSDSYNVRSYRDNCSALERIEQRVPIAVIYDVYSMQNGFNEFLESIRKNKRMEQIITIALTSSLQTTEREEYAKLGADLCISFPFNMNYLRMALEKLLQKQKSTAEYYKSHMSTFTLNEGKIIHQEDKDFIDKVFKTIDRNISNPELTAPMIADMLGTSTRVMYRKLENITDKKLHQIIRETRMSMAVSLLSSSKLTIDEIMYKVGYDNRSTFYRNFKEIYGKTPREYREHIHKDMMKNFTQP